MHWPFNRSSLGSPNVRRNYMVMSVPWLNYPLTIEALKGGGGGGWNKLACSPKIDNLFSLFACSPQKLQLPPLFPWNKCPFTLFPKTHGRPHQLLTYTPPSILLLLLCLLFPSCSSIFFIFAGIIMDGPNPFCEKVLLLLENGLLAWHFVRKFYCF